MPLSSTWQGFIRNEQRGQIHTLFDVPLIPKVRPPFIENWDDVLKHEPSPVLKAHDGLVFVHDNDFYPIKGVEWTPEEKEEARTQLRIQRKLVTKSNASASDLTDKWTGPGFLMMVGATVVVVLVIVLIVLPTILKSATAGG